MKKGTVDHKVGRGKGEYTEGLVWPNYVKLSP